MDRWLGGRRWAIAPAVVAALLLLLSAAFAFWPSQGWTATFAASRQPWTERSWSELSDIAGELSSCGSEQEAWTLGKRYGLCEGDGTLDVSGSKDVMLTDGTTAHVILLGLWHDERTEGGRAGMSFALCIPELQHPMNHGVGAAAGDGDVDDSTGGWAASDMRAWLESDLWQMLPMELRSSIVRVQKRTASDVSASDELAEAGKLAGSGTDWVGETSDRLWLISASELCGTVPPREDLGVDETMCGVYAAEGSQYQLFAQAQVTAFEPQALLAQMAAAGEGTPETWWLRTKTLEFGDGFWLVGTDGTPLNGLGEDARVVNDPEFAPDEQWGTGHDRALVVGFCL